MFALSDILPDRHLQCWKLFVKALENLYVLSGIHRVCISIVIYVNVILILAVCIASGASRLSITMEF